MQYMESELPLNEVDEALGCVCRQWATVRRAEKEYDEENEGKGSDAVVAGE